MAPSELVDLVNYESEMASFRFKNDTRIEIIGDYSVLRDLAKVKINFTVDQEHKYQTFLDDKFVAQVIKRIHDSHNGVFHADREEHIINNNSNRTTWKRTNSFTDELRALKVYLHYSINNDYNSFIEKITKQICQLTAIIHPPTRVLYGFVSDKYQPTDQLKFREEFLSSLMNINSGLIINKSTILLEKDRIIETFFYDSGDCEIEICCGLVYGKNNGYGSYYLTWRRRFKETKAKLLPFETETKYNWRNNAALISDDGRYNLESFTNHVAEEGEKILKDCYAIIKMAKDDRINSSVIMDTFDSILDKVACAKASKDRVKSYYKEHYFDIDDTHKYSRWAIAQSICNTGSFNRAVPFSMKELLLKAGTALLDEGFEQFGNSYTKDSFRLTVRT